MQMMKVAELVPHPRNDEFFDDMSGEKWNEFLESVKTSGVIEPIVITQDKVIVSGHQRVRACKELGIDTIMAETRHYDNDDAVLKDLIETNVRQRGSIGGSDIKLGNRIRALERIYGVRNGSAISTRGSNGTSGKSDMTQQELAEQMGIDLNTLRRAKKLTDLPPEIQDLVEQGNISASTASRLIAKLSPEEQEKLISALPVSEHFTQKQVQSYVDQICMKDNQIAGYELKAEQDKQEKERLRTELEQERSRKPEVRVVDKTDYGRISTLESKIRDLEQDKAKLERMAKLNEDDAEKFNKLKSEIEFLTKKRDDISRKIESASELAELTVRLQRLLEEELAPIKYKRTIERLGDSKVARNNLQEVIDKVQSWIDEMNEVMTGGLTNTEMESYIVVE